MSAMRRKLCILLAVLALGILALEGTRTQALKETAPLMLEATARTRRAFEAVHAERERLGFPADPADDPNGTGMVGPMYTDITTTLGALDAKRSTTNPNVAAMLVDMLLSIGLEPGDRVAVNLSGSFPCLNIAMLCAMDTLGLEGIVLYSVGASTYGATIPSFTYGDMEHFLYTEGLVSTRSAGFSLGGQDDLGLEMPEDLRLEIVERLSGYGYAYLSYDEMQENIQARIQLYEEGRPVRCFVNIGGNLVSFGASSSMATTPGGILTTLPSGERGNGLTQHYLRAGVPVLHLLNMKGLLPEYGLPVDPVPLPPDGSGGVYFENAYNQPLLLALLATSLGGIIWASRKRPK